MYKTTVKYTDYDGKEKSETLYFNLTKAELMELEVTTPGTLTGRLAEISDKAAAEDIAEIFTLFKEIILKAYGEKTTDSAGITRFRKSKAISEAFATTEAFSEMFMGFMQNPETATAFVNAVIPASAVKAVGTSETAVTE